MADYQAPLRDMRFVLNEVFEVADLWSELPGLAEVIDGETAIAVQDEAGRPDGEMIEFKPHGMAGLPLPPWIRGFLLKVGRQGGYPSIRSG